MKFIKLFYIISLLFGPILGATYSNPREGSFPEDLNSHRGFRGGIYYLYWKTEEDNLTVAYDTSISHEPVTSVLKVKDQNPQFLWESGYRIFAGYDFNRSWSLDLFYTYVPAKSRANVFVAESDNYVFVNEDDFPILQNLDTPLFESINSKWNMTFNYIDIDIGKNVCLAESLIIRPHIGVRIGWMNQNLYLSGDNIQSADDKTTQYVHMCTKERFKGCGVEGGVYADWVIDCGFSLLGHAGGSILYSNFLKSSCLEIYGSNINRVVPQQMIEQKGRVTNGTPTLDYLLGIKYENKCWNKEFSIILCWEQHVWFHMNKLNEAGNLSTQGLTAGFNIGF